MADPNTRQGKRTPVTLKIKFKSETIEQFIERYAVDVSQGGIFIRTKEPLAVGTQMKFEFQLRDASPLISGEGTVVWTRENDPSRPAIAPGMGVRFDRLNDGSQTVLERILAEKAKQAPNRSGPVDTTGKPPLFTDTPTKVAPAPVQEALGVRRSRADSEQTPLPKPMPFHSDADDFDERAFEEATKVRALEELAAQTALDDEEVDDTKTELKMPPDELAARRRLDDSAAEPPAPDSDRESAPGLPNPPEGRRLLDTTPSPRAATDEPGMRTKLGVEPAKAATSGRTTGPEPKLRRDIQPMPAHDVPDIVTPKRPSSAPIIILILVLVATAAAGVWWFVLRDQVTNDVATKKKPEGSGSSGSSTAIQPSGSDTGSQVAVANSGSDQVAPAGSNAVEPPKGPVVDTVIASSVAKGATVEIVGTDQKGPAPFTAKLEKDKAYKARVLAPGFAALEIDVKGGQDKATAKLVAKSHVLSVTSDPPGADIYVDGTNMKKVTPADVELSAAQAAKPKVRVSVRRTGFRPVDQVVDASTYSEDDAKLTAKVEIKLQKMAASPVPHPPTGTGSGSSGGSAAPQPNTGSGAGSATPAGSGASSGGNSAGSAATPTPPPGGGTPGTGAGSAASTNELK